MRFQQDYAELFIPDGVPEEAALSRTTHLAIGAHQDDIEIMAAEPILACFQHPERWFTGVVVTDGRGSPRSGLYQRYDDDEMRLVRFKEQRKAAVLGEYAAQILLDYPSAAVKDANNPAPETDIRLVLQASNPEIVYTHNLADKHDTHVAVALRVISAIRSLPVEKRPKKLYGCEVWRSLDWLLDSDKAALDVSEHENLQQALVGVFDSQIAGGKRYDLAAAGRRKANATYNESHGVDQAAGLSYAMDMTPLAADDQLDIAEFTGAFVGRLADDISARLQRCSRR